MIRVCFLVIAGGYAAQLSRLSPSSDLCGWLLVASIAMLASRRTRWPGCLILGLALFFQAGNAIVGERIESRYAGDSLLCRVRVLDFPKVAEHSITMLVEPLDDERLPPRSLLSWFEPPHEPAIGDVWQLEIRLRRPRGYSNPGIFDREAWLFRQKIHATGYVVSGKRNVKLQTGSENVIDRFRGRFITRASVAAPTTEVAAVLAAVGVGARHMISRKQWDDYAISGTSHLMAISGLHVGLAGSFAFFLVRLLLGLLRTGGDAQMAAIASGALAAVAYTAVSGLGVPAQRASVMLVMGAVALLRRRPVEPVSVVGAAALLVFVLDPVATMTPGFSLSFAAVLLLIWFARRAATRPENRHALLRIVDTVRQLFVVQLFLLFGLMPLTTVLFQRLAWLATPVNLLAVPLFSLITVPFTLAGMVAGDHAGVMGSAALKVAAASITWLHAIIELLTRLPYTDLTLAAIQGYAWPMAILPCAWALLPRGWPCRRVAPLAVAALILHTPETPPSGCVDTHVLDVGQGLATVVQTHNANLLFDTGAAFPNGGSVAEQVIVPFLKSRRIKRINWLIVSHADIDHAGGIHAILDFAEVDSILVGEALPDVQSRVSPCQLGQAWAADGVGFRMLHPVHPARRGGNNSSCVLLLQVGRHGLLLTGDIEAGAEREIVASNELVAVDAVVVPHHGSLTSSSVPFVDAVSPALAIVSTGFANRWGFPKERVVERWQAVGAEVLDTGVSGAVSLRLCASGGLQKLRLDRQERRRFWRDSAGQG